jgi:26S proteasome regulatory subunit N8
LQDGTTTSKTFVHTPSTIEAEEAEEIGVEHLLRDIRDVAVGTLSTRITSQLSSLQGLHLRLQDIGKYLQKVLNGDLPVNHAILGNLQDVFNLLPNLSTPPANAKDLSTVNGMVHAMSVKTNDQLMSIYLSSLIRSITAFHDLIDNKIQNKRQADDDDAKQDEDKKDKDIKKEEKLMLNGANEKSDAGSKEGKASDKESKDKKKG